MRYPDSINKISDKLIGLLRSICTVKVFNNWILDGCAHFGFQYGGGDWCPFHSCFYTICFMPQWNCSNFRKHGFNLTACSKNVVERDRKYYWTINKDFFLSFFPFHVIACNDITSFKDGIIWIEQKKSLYQFWA